MTGAVAASIANRQQPLVGVTLAQSGPRDGRFHMTQLAACSDRE